ncbi:hypothetical protein Q4543_20720 [Salipiger sp. 1_MG-2023]|uniref:hypothetical protein n=1 Tax=Salipiger sp. 1_MG-2023 TaxID=3062665 RepID=UPI0026E36208|nr:hypothetical protein [Salipiger sp. 1_MG-2023]MDO6587939.1 hypothetical protein [Salipiger sp. 1_MG-2023]
MTRSPLIRLLYARICALFCLWLAAGPGAAETQDLAETHEVSRGQMLLAADYAVCLGRLTALLQHSWLIQDPLADALELRRDWVRALYDATRLPLPGETQAGRELNMMLRIRAKRDQLALLETGSFNDDARRARLAETTAMNQLFTCHRMINR